MMDLQQRIDSYVDLTGYPRSLFISDDQRIVGTWLMGQNYTVRSQYYGGFPSGYLRRVKALFPDKQKVLHLFSGKVDLKEFPGDTVDINASLKPNYVDDAQTLQLVPLEIYDLVLCDPPYSVEDAEHYKTTMIKRNIVMRNLGMRLPISAHVVWLDQVLPMWKKSKLKLTGAIGMMKSSNHRFRMVSIFEKHDVQDSVPSVRERIRLRKAAKEGVR
jgi:16S rRNA G966 N2-methylase RsmD